MALGKGLDKIFGEGVETVLEEIQSGKSEFGTGKTELPIAEIRPNPYQPRKTFDESKINELASSIKEHGVFTPILVRKSINGYELVAGERRYRACQKLKLETIPAIIVDFNDDEMMEIALLENIQRENLNIIEEAQAYQQLLNKNQWTQDILADRLGKSRVHVTNTLRLLKLPKKIQTMVVDNKLSMGHVRPLITMDDENQMLAIAEKIIDEGLSVRAVEKLIKNSREIKSFETNEVKTNNNELLYVQELVQNKLQTKVKVDKKSIVISYNDTNDLNRILELLGCIED